MGIPEKQITFGGQNFFFLNGLEHSVLLRMYFIVLLIIFEGYKIYYDVNE